MSSERPQNREFDRRALFFLCAALMAAVMIPVITSSLRYVPTIVLIMYLVLATASYLDWRSYNR